jgi:methyl-accepting chemotaxis protein
VEAARVGEHGRGFAMVASEVRLLAQRSAGAAKEVKPPIGASVERVETGARQVADAGSTMREIESSAKRVTPSSQRSARPRPNNPPASARSAARCKSSRR